jgi:hypothetical protein
MSRPPPHDEGAATTEDGPIVQTEPVAPAKDGALHDLADAVTQHTPQAAQLVPATLFNRLRAACADVLLGGFVCGMLMLTTMGLILMARPTLNEPAEKWLGLTVFCFLILLYNLIEPLAGRSIGKSIFGLQVGPCDAIDLRAAAWRRFAVKNAGVVLLLLFGVAGTVRTARQDEFEFWVNGWPPSVFFQATLALLALMFLMLVIKFGPARQSPYDRLCGTTVYQHYAPGLPRQRGFEPVLRK